MLSVLMNSEANLVTTIAGYEEFAAIILTEVNVRGNPEARVLWRSEFVQVGWSK